MTPSRTPATDEPTVTVSLRVPADMKAELQALAKKDDRTLNWYIGRVLAAHIEANR